MRNLKMSFAKILLVFMGCMMLTVLVPIESHAQVKINDISQVTGEVQKASTAMADMAKYIIGAVLFIALIGVIYMVASSHPKSKEAVIGWIAAIVVYIIAINII